MVRATVGLGRLLRNTNRCEEAQTILDKVDNWFAEGADSPISKRPRRCSEDLDWLREAGRCLEVVIRRSREESDRTD